LASSRRGSRGKPPYDLRDSLKLRFLFETIEDAENVTPNMVPMDNPTEEDARKLSSEFRQIFFAN
jgi:hypothetical protein